jgi:predicted RNA-binding protein with TRAM domain
MIEPPVPDAAVIVAVLIVLLVVGWLLRRRGGRPATAAQRDRDRAHRDAQKRPPEEAARKGETYELVVKETQYDRVPPEIRGTINGLQTFVREVPDPDGSSALETGETIRVQVTDYGSKGTTAQARFLGRA